MGGAGAPAGAGGFYGEDLAVIHDAGFGGMARAAAGVLIAALGRGGITRGRVVDLGCGSGILAEALAAAGFDVLGIDLSPAMVALARARVPGGEFREGSLVSAELPPCVGVAAVGEVLNYLADEGNTGAALRALIGRVAGALEPGGVFLGDVAGPGRVPGGARQVNAEGEGWAVMVTAEEGRESGVITRRITSFRRAGDLYRRDHEIHRQRLIRPAELAGPLRAAGLRARVLRGYAALRFPPGLAAVLARRPT